MSFPERNADAEAHKERTIAEVKEAQRKCMAGCFPNLAKFMFLDCQDTGCKHIGAAWGMLQMETCLFFGGRCLMNETGGQWPVGPCDCCVDLPNSCVVLTLPECAFAHIAADEFDAPPAAGLSFVCSLCAVEAASCGCLSCCAGAAVAATVSRFRRKYGIAGSFCNDYFKICCCCPCYMNQMYYVATHYGDAANPFEGLTIDSNPWAKNPLSAATKRETWMETKMQHVGSAPVPSEQAMGSKDKKSKK